MDSNTLNETVPETDGLTVLPDEADRAIGDLPGVTRWEQFGGRTAYQVTLGTPGKPHIYFTRPHAHEPAGTAACFEWIKRLTGKEQDSWARWVLEHFRVSFMADANPSGSQRAPVKFWDGSDFPNEVFFLWMFGESGDEPGKRFPRVSSWDVRTVTPPSRIGIAYEQIDEYTYVEPNRDHRSTFFRAYFDLNARERVDVWLDLHQTEYIGSDRNTHINLPTNVEQMTPALRDQYWGLGEAIIERWRKSGAAPRNEPQHPYKGNQAQFDFLNAVWSSITPSTLHLVTEVQNNNPRTPTSEQVRLQMAAMDETLRYVHANPGLTSALADSRTQSGDRV